jgi:hypothetical protein
MKTTRAVTVLLVAIFYAPSAHADSFGTGLNAFDIEFVAIGNPGNLPDTTGIPNPAGTVLYPYRMGKYEISREMITKANTDGGLAIPLANIPIVNGANRPATGPSWNEAARFVNWLNASTGSMPAYKFALQPGEVGYSANANILLWDASDDGYNPNNLYRNSLARYFLPSADEWYKAAYYDPSANGGAGGYWNFATGSDTAPTAVASGTAGGTAVYGQPPTPSATGPADITLAGGLSPYGTMGQGGNVDEWEETDFDLVNGPTGSSARAYRGGSWDENSSILSSSFRTNENPSSIGRFSIGFRVASTSEPIVPEPCSMLMGALASVGLLLRRSRPTVAFAKR